MTEKEKMILGELYDANDNMLIKDRACCKDLCYEYNSTYPSDTQKQAKIMSKILGRIKGEFSITAPFWCDYGYNIEIGKNFYTNHNCIILDCAKVTFGDNVLIGPDCGFYTAAHPIDAAARNTSVEYAKPITVGDNVWFGGGVKVLPGVKIGSNVVIGAGSIVTKDIPDNVIAFGNPCRIIRYISNK